MTTTILDSVETDNFVWTKHPTVVVDHDDYDFFDIHGFLKLSGRPHSDYPDWRVTVSEAHEDFRFNDSTPRWLDLATLGELLHAAEFFMDPGPEPIDDGDFVVAVDDWVFTLSDDLQEVRIERGGYDLTSVTSASRWLVCDLEPNFRFTARELQAIGLAVEYFRGFVKRFDE